MPLLNSANIQCEQSMSPVGAAAPSERLQKSKPLGVRLRELVGPSFEVLQAVIVFALLAWLIYRGAAAMGYKWQWYRAAPFFYRIVDGQLIWGPLIRGLIVTLQIAGISMVLSIAIGFATAALRLSDSIAGRLLAMVYLE